MKKRFMLVAVLLGSLALASCVDDKESDSVTAIRNAKVERLKAAAAFDYAQAAYKQAQAAIEQVEASVASETKAAQIEKILAEYKKDVAQANKDATIAQKGAFDEASELLANAYNKYTGAVATLRELQEDALEAQAKLARAEVDSAATQAVYQEYVAQQTATIQAQTAILERLKAIDENSLDKDELNSKLQALVAQAYTLKSTDQPQADVAAKAAAEEVAEAYAKIAPSATLAGITDPGPSATAEQANKYAYDLQVYEDNLMAYVAAAQYLQDLVGTAGASVNFFDEVLQEGVDIDGWWKAESETLFEPEAASDIAKATIEVTNYLKGIITTEKATLGTKKTDTAAATDLYLALENAEAALKTAQDNLADAKAATPVVPADVEAAEADVADANVAVLVAQEAVANQEEVVKEAEDALAEFNAALEVIKEGSDAQKEYAAAIEALVKLQEAKLVADKKLYEVELAINTIGITGWRGTEVAPGGEGAGEYGTLWNIYNDVVDVKEAIATCEKEIAQAELNIEKGTGDQFMGWEEQSGEYWDPTISDWHSGWLKVPVYAEGKPVDLATLKAQLQADLDFIKEKIALQEGIVAEYKAALEALINSED